jgi:hypothetical protein
MKRLRCVCVTVSRRIHQWKGSCSAVATCSKATSVVARSRVPKWSEDMMRLGTSLLAALALTAVMAAPAGAAPILVGSTVTFDLLDTGFGDFSDTKLIAAAGNGINQGDGSNIGDGAMLSGEFIHVLNTSIQFSLFGGDTNNVVDAGPPRYLGTGYGPGARYVLSGLFDPLLAEITGVSIGLSNVTNVALGTQVLFDAHSVTLYIDDLGILESASNLGLVTLNLTARDLGTGPGPAPVPEPATLTLLGSGIAAAWFRRRRASRRNVS